MARSLATVEIIVRMQEQGTAQAVASVGKGLDDVEAKATRTGRQTRRAFADIAGAFTSLFVIREVARGFAGFLKPAADMEMSLARLKGLLHGTGVTVQDLKRAAIEADFVTRFTPTQAVDTMGLLIRNGVAARDTMKVILPTLKLAQAAEIETGQAAQVTAALMREWHVQAKNVAQTMNQVFFLSTKFGVAASTLPNVMKRLAADASFGAKNMGDLIVTFGLASGSAAQTMRTATELKSAFVDLNRSAKATALASVGVDTRKLRGEFDLLMDVIVPMFEHAQKTAGGFDHLRHVLTGMGTFGAAANQAILPILAKLKDGVKDLNGQMRFGRDAAETLLRELAKTKILDDFAKNVLAPFEASVGRVEKALFLMGIELGTPLLEPLTVLADQFFALGRAIAISFGPGGYLSFIPYMLQPLGVIGGALFAIVAPLVAAGAGFRLLKIALDFSGVASMFRWSMGAIAIGMGTAEAAGGGLIGVLVTLKAALSGVFSLLGGALTWLATTKGGWATLVVAAATAGWSIYKALSSASKETRENTQSMADDFLTSEERVKQIKSDMVDASEGIAQAAKELAEQMRVIEGAITFKPRVFRVSVAEKLLADLKAGRLGIDTQRAAEIIPLVNEAVTQMKSGLFGIDPVKQAAQSQAFLGLARAVQEHPERYGKALSKQVEETALAVADVGSKTAATAAAASLRNRGLSPDTVLLGTSLERAPRGARTIPEGRIVESFPGTTFYGGRRGKILTMPGLADAVARQLANQPADSGSSKIALEDAQRLVAATIRQMASSLPAPQVQVLLDEKEISFHIVRDRRGLLGTRVGGAGSDGGLLAGVQAP